MIYLLQLKLFLIQFDLFLKNLIIPMVKQNINSATLNNELPRNKPAIPPKATILYQCIYGKRKKQQIIY